MTTFQGTYYRETNISKYLKEGCFKTVYDMLWEHPKGDLAISLLNYYVGCMPNTPQRVVFLIAASQSHQDVQSEMLRNHSYNVTYKRKLHDVPPELSHEEIERIFQGMIIGKGYYICAVCRDFTVHVKFVNTNNNPTIIKYRDDNGINVYGKDVRRLRERRGEWTMQHGYGDNMDKQRFKELWEDAEPWFDKNGLHDDVEFEGYSDDDTDDVDDSGYVSS